MQTDGQAAGRCPSGTLQAVWPQDAQAA